MKIRVLWVGECSAFSTGFGTVTRHILSRIHADTNFEVRQLALSYNGNPDVAKLVPFDMYPCAPNGFGEDVFLQVVTSYKPNIVVWFGDPWHSKFAFGTTEVMGKQIPFVDQSLRRQMQFVTYYPLDGVRPNIEWIDQMAMADHSVFCAKFAMKACKDIRSHLRTSYIPHGVDTNIFKPVSEQEKQDYRRQLPIKGDDPFLIGMVARNQARKDYPQLFRAIRIARETIPNLYCYCHCLRQDQGWDLDDLARQEGVSDRVIFNTSLQVANAGVDDNTMRLIYGSMDLFVLPTQGEGFGLPLLEAMSCGIPCVTTDYAATADLLKEANGGLLAQPAMYHYRGGDHNIRRPITSEQDLSDKIIYAWKNRTEMKGYGENGRKFALTMDWDIVAEEFKKLFKNLITPSVDSQIIARDIA